MVASTAHLDELLNHMYRTATFSKPTNVYVSLHTGDPGQSGANEVSGGGYTRVSVSAEDASWDAPSGTTTRTIINAIAITFPNPSANWGTITHVGLWSAASGGTFKRGAALTVSRAILDGDIGPAFAIGALSISES